MSGLSIQLPWDSDPSVKWVRIDEIAAEWRRSRRTICRWRANGTLAKLGYRIYKDLYGRLWIGVPRAPIPSQDI